MSKKLLNESTIRRFGALANLNPVTTNSFLSEVEDEEEVADEEFGAEEEIEVEEPLGLDLDAEEEVELEVGSGDPAEDLVRSLVDHIATWASEKGVSMGVEGGEEDMLGGEEDMLGGEEDMLGGEEDMLGGEEDMLGGEEDMLGAEEEFDLEEAIKLALSEEEEGGEKKGPPNPKLPNASESKMSAELVKEVSRRVKQRLTKLYKSKSK